MGKAKVGVLYVHGVGTQGQNFADDDIAHMKKRLGVHADEVAFSSYCWQGLIEPREKALMLKNNSVRWRLLRKILASYGGDALCYQPRHGLDSFYEETHKGLDDVLSTLAFKMAPDGKLVIVCHSLGTIIVNNFIWDSQNVNSVGAAEYDPNAHALDRLQALYTLGSPIAIWSLRYPDGGKPIQLPENCVWRNIYCPSDIVGWPLRTINMQYCVLKGLRDYRMWVGSFTTRWNPMSHLGYMNNKKVVQMIANDIIKLLK